MRDFRIYMAVGGMPQAVDAYAQGGNFAVIDQVKREIIGLYKADFKKLDPSGRTSAIFDSIPAQLSAQRNQFRISTATGKRSTSEDRVDNDIYTKLLGDNFRANLYYLYENVIAQIIASSGKNLYYHGWRPKGKNHSYEVDFLLTDKTRVAAVEVKSSNVNNHKPIDEFAARYSQLISRRILSQKDISKREMLELQPLYLALVIIDRIGRKKN